MNKIKNRVKELRKSKGITQDEMAKILGYKNKSGYSQLENGVVKMTIDKAKIIASTLGISPEEISFK